MDRAINLRQKIANSEKCFFEVEITADYQDSYYQFSMECEFDATGAVKFVVTKPDSISGITGSVSAEGGKLTFDDRSLLFATLADGQITPVSAPWLFMKGLSGGYIMGCGAERDGLLLSVKDSYDEDSFLIEIYTDDQDLPVSADLYWKNCRVISLRVKNFRIS